MEKRLLDFFEKEKIKLYSVLDFNQCHILAQDKIFKYFGDHTPKSVFLILVPYLVKSVLEDPQRNISLYAAIPDYHVFFKRFLSELSELLQELYPGYTFAGFSDNSPIDERHAALLSGLGTIGDNHLLLTEEYSSFIFISEIISDMPVSMYHFQSAPQKPAPQCMHCRNCTNSCPVYRDGIDCLSMVTQKKGELSDAEIAAIRKYQTAWGCDICQLNCPITQRAIQKGSIYPEIAYFQDNAVNRIHSDMIQTMDKETFRTRAFAWRGRNCILRNLKILEENGADKINGT